MRDGKLPLDRGRTPTPGRTAEYARIARESGETPGEKKLAMIRRPRDEDDATRAARFAEIERQGVEP
jgi:hypothetical protein